MPKGVYTRTSENTRKPRIYPPEIIALAREMYEGGMTVAEIRGAFPQGYRVQTILERHLPSRRPAVKRDQRGDRNHMWKGDAPGYAAAHLRVKAARGAAHSKACADCGRIAADWSYDYNASGELTESGLVYSSDPTDYSARCRPCRRRFDRIQRQERAS